LTEQQQTTTPGPTAPDAPAEATEAEAPAGPAVAVVEDSLVATAADGSPEQPTLEPESLEVEPSVTQPEAARPEPETQPVAVAQSEAAQPEPETQPVAVAQSEAAQPEPETPPVAVAQSEAAQPEPETQPEAAQPVAVAQSEAAQPEPETPPVAVAQSEAAQPEPETPAAREPATMAELLAEQDATIRSFKHGDVVEGSVVRIDREEILVDIGAKSEGVVSNRELYGRNAETAPSLAVGDTVLVYVLQPESPEGHAVLSLRRAGLERKWRAMQEQFEAGLIIEAPVIDHNKGGLIVDCGIRGFVPISQIVDFPRRPQNEQPRDAAQEIAEKLQPYVGRRLRLKILEVNRKANRLILSEKVALYEERREKRDELFSSLQVGQRVTGSVRSIAPFGIFIDLGGIDGLVHKSELSWNKVNNPEAGYKVGSEVEAEVIDINHERGRISLSIRRLQPDPWHSTVASFRVGDVIEGTVTKLVNFGAFVRVRDGLEGLIHISELSHQRVAHPGDVVREGQTLKMKIISLDSERHRLGLSLKQAEEPPPRPAPEPRPRRERPDRGYSISDAVQEPEGGIDKTLAAAFAQVRQQLAEAQDDRSVADQPAEAAIANQPAEPAAGGAAEPPVAAAVADQAAEAALADQPADQAAEAAFADQPAEPPVEAALADQPAEAAIANQQAEPPVEAALADQPATDGAAERA
jgi:small subunit ribosomal protein S1